MHAFMNARSVIRDRICYRWTVRVSQLKRENAGWALVCVTFGWCRHGECMVDERFSCLDARWAARGLRVAARWTVVDAHAPCTTRAYACPGRVLAMLCALPAYFRFHPELPHALMHSALSLCACTRPSRYHVVDRAGPTTADPIRTLTSQLKSRRQCHTGRGWETITTRRVERKLCLK